MKKIIICVAMLFFSIAAFAQMSPEAIMDQVPKMPSVEEMIRYYRETTAPITQNKTVTQPNLFSDFMEALKAAKERVQESNDKYAEAYAQKVKAGKVTGTNLTVEQASNMSDAELEQVAMKKAQSMMGGVGLSAADMAKLQSGNLSEAEQAAMVNKIMQNQTGLSAADVQKMQNMTDEQRAAYMQQNGRMDAVNAKMAANKGKLQKDQTVANLLTELNKNGKYMASFANLFAEKGENTKKAGLALYDKKYRKTMENLQAALAQAYKDGAGSEKYTEEEAPKVEAANRRAEGITNNMHKTMCEFYGEYIPMWRSHVVNIMNICKTDYLSAARKQKEITDKLYSLTKEAQYANGDIYPFQAASAYLDLSEEITDYELDIK